MPIGEELVRTLENMGMVFEDWQLWKRWLSNIDAVSRQVGNIKIDGIAGLSEITTDAGVLLAGEFRSGNQELPGDGFSGVRMGYPGFTYDAETWNLVGISNDTLQVGLRASDGKLVAGGGVVVLNEDGILVHTPGAGELNPIKFTHYQLTGDYEYAKLWYTDAIGSEGSLLLVVQKTETTGMALKLSTSQRGTLQLANTNNDTIFEVVDSGDAEHAISTFKNVDSLGHLVIVGDTNGCILSTWTIVPPQLTTTERGNIPAGHFSRGILFNTTDDKLQFYNSGSDSGWRNFVFSEGAVVLNEAGGDFDFRVEGVGQPNAVFVQGSDGSVGIGTGAPVFPLSVRSSTAVSGQMADFIYTGASGSNAGGFIKVGNDDGAALASGHRIGGFIFTGSKSASATQNSVAVIATAAGNWTTSSTPSYLTFQTTPSGSTTRSEVLKIQSGGGVLIMGVSDTQQLKVKAHSTQNQNIVEIQDSNAAVLTLVNPTGFVRGGTAFYRNLHHLSIESFDPGASGATWTDSDANTVGGWQLTAVGHELHAQVDVHADWDGVSDLTMEVYFEINAASSENDTVDIKAEFFYKGVSDTATKIQTVEVSTNVGDGGVKAQYTMFKATFVIDWDKTDHVVEIGDILHMHINLETDTSEVDDIIINKVNYYYSTTHLGVESGDV